MPQKPHNKFPRTSAKDEKFTPLKYMKSVKNVLGEIEIDLFSCFEANLRIKAQRVFTKENSAFNKKWEGKVFANPPYGRGFLDIFATYAIKEYLEARIKQGIFLVPNRTDMTWFHKLLSLDLPVCLVDHRISFVDGFRYIKDVQDILNEFPSAKLLTSPEEGSVFFYLGNNPLKFAQEFSKWGSIINIVPIQKEGIVNHATINKISTTTT